MPHTLDEAKIRAMLPNAGARLTPHLPYIVPALEWGRIVTPPDITAFFGQIAVESMEYQFMEEIADGSAYDQRTDLGNTPELDGDGQWFKGHGPMQITGYDAHLACGVALGIDLVKNPRLITLPEYATKSAVWFWTKFKPWLQPAALYGWYRVCTRLINGGYTHLDRRVAYFQRNLSLFGMAPYSAEGEVASIMAFQTKHGLVVDGQVGPKTLAKLISK
jgi:putative chitinase